MSTQTPENGLEPYREQARELQEALTKVKAIQDQTAAVTLQRETVSKQRQGLLDSFEDESAVAELSKLGSRVEMHDAKLASLAGKLVEAEAELKAALAGFAISFNALFLTLRTFLIKEATARIAVTLHPKVRQISGASIAEVAALSTEVVDFEPLAVRVDPMASMINNQLPSENIIRDAERSLPKAEPLLAEAAKHLENGFVPPQAFGMETWRATVSPGVPVAA
jgi:hypothetical protein